MKYWYACKAEIMKCYDKSMMNYRKNVIIEKKILRGNIIVSLYTFSHKTKFYKLNAIYN